jgi:hypothetical protein
MPHAEPEKMGQTTVNGEKVHSHFIDVSDLWSFIFRRDVLTVYAST